MVELENVPSHRYIEAQQAVLGSMILDPRCADTVMRRVGAEDFTVDAYRTIYSTIRGMWLEREAIDPVTIVSRVPSSAEQDTTKIVRELLEVTPTSANVEKYIDILKDESTLHQIRDTGLQLRDAVGLEEARKILAGAESLALGKPKSIGGVLEGVQAWYLNMREKPPEYLDWGFPKINSRVKVTPGNFVVLGADSSVGKTSMALQMAYHFADTGKRVVFFSLETDKDTLWGRLMAQQIKCSLVNQQMRLVGESNCRDALALMHQLERKSTVLDIVDDGEITMEAMRAAIISGRYDVAFIDYLQLIPTEAYKNPVEAVRHISLTLHRMARSLGVTIVALSQLTIPEDAPKNWVPTADNLRESRQLKNDADVIFLLYLANRKVPSGNRRLACVKNKQGPKGGAITLEFSGLLQTFTEVDDEPANEQEEMSL